MNLRLAAVLAVWPWIVPPASAHRLDEYLQATTIAVEKSRVTAQVRLTPGVGLFRVVMAGIDADEDGVVSDGEQRAYAESVLRDLSLALDGGRLRLRLVSSVFPTVGEMREGVGDIVLRFEADAPRKKAARRLIFENHHQSALSVYLVNCLVPSDPELRVTAQDRNYEQSSYRLDYIVTGE